jgi:hypothetical protein
MSTHLIKTYVVFDNLGAFPNIFFEHIFISPDIVYIPIFKILLPTERWSKEDLMMHSNACYKMVSIRRKILSNILFNVILKT